MGPIRDAIAATPKTVVDHLVGLIPSAIFLSGAVAMMHAASHIWQLVTLDWETKLDSAIIAASILGMFIWTLYSKKRRAPELQIVIGRLMKMVNMEMVTGAEIVLKSEMDAAISKISGAIINAQGLNPSLAARMAMNNAKLAQWRNRQRRR